MTVLLGSADSWRTNSNFELVSGMGIYVYRQITYSESSGSSGNQVRRHIEKLIEDE